ncbi:hypothetical protein GWK47_032043 [Chionoecetes opilio]|uniref:Uncharacterized protein n=1 Tax=Chionoecetes opilio TaxID=41210 RepID=A0A8J4YIF6_CHIOP|nr:hypothetical protein GWK47_032043 [Chionoecetes opilio]
MLQQALYEKTFQALHPNFLGDVGAPVASMFPFMKSNLSKSSDVRLALLAFMMSDPWENSLSTAADLGMAVLYLTNTSTQDGRGRETWPAPAPCSSEHQLSSSFPILLEAGIVGALCSSLNNTKTRQVWLTLPVSLHGCVYKSCHNTWPRSQNTRTSDFVEAVWFKQTDRTLEPLQI